MKIYIVSEISWIEGHWKIKSLIDLFQTKDAAERRATELTRLLPKWSSVTDEEVDSYEIEEREVAP